MLQSSSTGPGRVNVFVVDPTGRIQAGVESLARAQRKHVVKVGIVVAKRHVSLRRRRRARVARTPCSPGSTRAVVRERWGSGVGPSRRVSHSTAPPGPIEPPPLTLPLTVGARSGSAARAAAGGGSWLAATGVAADAPGPPARPAGVARPRAAATRPRATSGGRLGTFSNSSQSCAARAKSPASYAIRPPAMRFRIRYCRSTSVLNARSCGRLDGDRQRRLVAGRDRHRLGTRRRAPAPRPCRPRARSPATSAPVTTRTPPTS